MRKAKAKLPKYAADLEKENADGTNLGLGEGMEIEKSAKSYDGVDDESVQFEDEEAPIDMPPEAQEKIEKF